MKEIKDTCYKGTRILLGDKKRNMLNAMINVLRHWEFKEISMPVIYSREHFAGKVGIENSSMMFSVKDNGDRDLVLAPEYTAIVQKLAKTTFKHQKNVKLFYIQECFRGEKPQAGRYRQFTQLGVEILNCTIPKAGDYIKNIAADLLTTHINVNDLDINLNVTRGLDYYIEGKGFEICCNKLGAQKQICGGGAYEGGIGFAIGIDRLLCINNK